MKLHIILLIIVAGLLTPGRTEGLNEDDGFRRLLRRASVEADRPLVREQRRNKDDDVDEDNFGEIFEHKSSAAEISRKRRSEEDAFYHTLLSRSESKHHDKRSFDTNDVDNKAGYITREDWTGDSKISDADRQELENLFQKLNADDSPAKVDVARSADDESAGTVDGAAKDYAKWLMKQPANKIGAALSHKAEVDHTLTKLFFEDKRGFITTKKHQYTAQKRHKNDDDKPGNVKYPEPIKWMNSMKKSEAPIANATSDINDVKVNTTAENCSTAECLCERTCHPKPVTSATPCECKEAENKQASLTGGNQPQEAPIPAEANAEKPQTVKAAKVVAPSGSKLCNDDTPKCLCSRACYPGAVANLSPCNCKGETAPTNSTSSTPPLVQNNTAPQQDTTSSVQKDPTAAKNATAKAAQRTVVDPIARSWCSHACHPLGVTAENPCKCASAEPAVSTGNAFPPQAPVAFPPHAPAVAKNVQPIPAVVSPPVATPAKAAAAIPANAAAAIHAKVATPVAAKIAQPLVANPAVVAASTPVVAPVYQQPAYNAAPVASVINSVPNAPVPAFVAPAAPVAQPVNVPAVAANIPQTGNQPIVSAPVLVNDRADARQSVVPATDNACSRSCYPKRVINSNPCACEMQKKNATANTDTLFSTSVPVYTKHPSYQGCFKDRMPVRDLPKRFTRFETTPEACISECKYQNYKFAGVQYGYLCFCGDAFGRYGREKDEDCNSACYGDPNRHCGAFWHNSVYSVDGKEYDPTDFDFAKVDAAERLRDTLPAPAIKTVKKSDPATGAKNDYSNSQGANVASHLMKAAQAALKAAKKLLPSVSKKHKVHRKGHKGRKEKREDDEEDIELLQEKMAAIASLGAARQLIQKTNFGMDKRDSEREKRSIDEDSDPYDPDNGKDLLAAYLSNVALYKRQVRSVDDEEEEDDPNEKAKFEYRRMTLGENDDGEFVEKYEEEKEKLEKKKKRAVVTDQKKRSVSEGSGAGEKKKRSFTVDSGAGEKKKRSLALGSGAGEKKKRSLAAGSGAGEKKRRSLAAGSGAGEKKKRSLAAGSGAGEKKERSLAAGSGAGEKKKRSLSAGSGAVKRKRRSLLESNGAGERKKRSLAEGSGSNKRRRRSLPSSSGAGEKKKRSLTGSGAGEKKKRSLAEGSGVTQKKKRELDGYLTDGAVKMAARSDDINDIESSLRTLESMEKRNQVPEADDVMSEEESDEDDEEEDAVPEGEDESGESEESGDANIEEMSGGDSGNSEDRDVNKRNTDEGDMESLFDKRSTDDDKALPSVENATDIGPENETLKLRSDVERGVDSLLNLVVELYKQQKTIKVFEASVRSLRHDILKELNVPKDQRLQTTKKVRDEIQKTARERLHVLTSSIEHKITEFARTHPEASKQANLATSLLPKLPLNDANFAASQKEITRRSAEFDDIEDAFGDQDEVPQILKEHFKRNAEIAMEDTRPRRQEINGEEKLSRMHRDVQEIESETAAEGAEYDEEFENLFE